VSKFMIYSLTILFIFFEFPIKLLASALPQSSLKHIQLGNLFLDIGGNLRFRYEYQNNYNIKKYTDFDDKYLLERIRLNLDLKTPKGLKAFIQFQDSHCIDCTLRLSDFKGKCPYVNEWDLRQAYLEWSRINGSHFGFKIGRQQIAYRDKRVFGPGSWGNVGRYTWDVFMVKYESSYLNLDAFFAKRIFYLPKTFLDKHYPYNVYALYGQVKNLPIDFDIFYVYKFNQKDKIDKYGNFFPKERRHTLGFYFKGKCPLYAKDYFLRFSGLYAYQMGSYSSQEKDIYAYGYYINLGINYKLLIPQSFWLKYSYGSGDKNPNDNKIQTFDGIFSGMSQYFGRMNMFCWKNIEDYQLTYQLMPIRGLKIILDHHWFYLAQKADYWYYINSKPVQDRGRNFLSDYLGREWDAFAIYDINKHLQFQLAYCHFIPEAAIIDTGYHEESDYFIFQTFYKF